MSILDHDFLAVAGHPDDDECTHRSDGTDATYCGEPKSSHVGSFDEYVNDDGTPYHPHVPHMATDVLDALKAAGYAVVELPKPNQYDEWVADERGMSGPWTVWMSVRDIQVRTSGHCDAAQARAFAAALLAAADAAEARS